MKSCKLCGSSNIYQQCSKCVDTKTKLQGRENSLDEYMTVNIKRRTNSGRYSEQMKQYFREWKKKNPEKVKQYSKKSSTLDNPRRMKLGDRQIHLDKNPRRGICSICKRKVGEGIKRTAIHHVNYHLDDPLKDTIELCDSCHAKETWKLGQIKGRKRKMKLPLQEKPSWK